MKKRYAYDQLSDVQCSHLGCYKYLKMRLVMTKMPRNIRYCYKHEPKHMISGHSARGRD